MLEMHTGGRAGAVAGPENDGMCVPNCNHARSGRPGTVVGTSATAAQGGS